MRNEKLELDRHIEWRMGETRTPGMAVALLDREKTLRVAAYGMANRETQAPVTPDTLFEIGSVSKTFAAVAALQSAEAGLLDLHAPVAEYLPWFRVQTRHAPITIHHLLSHTSGLAGGVDADFSPDARGMVWSLRETEAAFAPGTHFYYAEANYQTLTLVLEAVHGQPYAEIVQAGILDPLGMTNTVAAITHDVRPRLARGYRPLYDDRPAHASHPLVPAPWLEMGSGDGCIASTAGDMARFGRMLLNRGGPILSKASYHLMTRPVIAEAEYGYGLYAFESDGFAHVGHGGDMPGYEAYLWLDVDNGLGMTMLVAQPYPSQLSWQVLELLRAAYLDQPLPTFPPTDVTRVEQAAEFAGTYHAGEKALTLVTEGDRLLLEHAGERLVLERRGQNRFYVPHPDFDRYLLQFGRQDGQVVEVTHGPDWYTNDRYAGPREFPYPAEWDAYPGHYRAHNPWASNFRVIVRQGELLLVWPSGDEEPLTPLADGSLRVGDEFSPERLRFDQLADGWALRATLTCCSYYRFFTP